VAKPPAFKDIPDRDRSVTTFSNVLTFPESLDVGESTYREAIHEFAKLIAKSESSEALLRAIRESSYRGKDRMSLLKLFRRCVSPVCDTERAKKIATVTTDSIIDACGDTFKSIAVLKAQFKQPLSKEMVAALGVLLAENDSRGQSGYALTGAFFDWFAAQPQFKGLTALGPRGAGSDIQLNTLIPGFDSNYPCDIVIVNAAGDVVAVGFARYDATRGGSQSDDRTGGNSNKVDKARAYFAQKGSKPFRLIFLSDGPGLLHGDTWREACALDGALDGAVRVTTLKLAQERISAKWLKGQSE
jgi:hypothetical protein